MLRRADGRRLRFGGLALAAAVIVAGGPSSAQNAVDLTKEMIGEWELSTAGRDRTCALSLKNDNAPGGRKLELEKGCGEQLPFTKSIASWAIKGLDIVRLQDGKGEAVLDLTEVENGIYEGTRQGEGVFILQNLAAARALTRSTDQMIGNWSVMRGTGKAICSVTLTNNDAGDESFQVFVKPRCDPSFAAFAPTTWRIERGELLLISAKREIWRFEADDNAQWRRMPDSADPLLLVRE
ncbi:AprI/Inh family metalloprotease inhibitor [Bradyrhizobium sp. LHD-71]|uniref:AprI/Inh family metalloprotease inhibitor n=1 Tax=Bradyrhizobium sp. LHD-71 TaxID=3072141 RepID=UPI00280F7035|nr:AprI/Inh family metalloprotease inhibitor [Bradyrhizobium sp. LHD-71]MDQ8727323.1 AprI/Inh family metalloprotease inhibitor [Bradyrhizobium sp. LHD-71]